MFVHLILQESRKRKLDKPVNAETLDGGQLRKAANLKNVEIILLEIRGKDCVALEVKYHQQCYKKFEIKRKLMDHHQSYTNSHL